MATPEQQAYESRDLTLDLGGCAPAAGPARITAALLACPGVREVHVDRHVTWALVTFDVRRTSSQEIVAHLARADLEASVVWVFDEDELAPPPEQEAGG